MTRQKILRVLQIIGLVLILVGLVGSLWPSHQDQTAPSVGEIDLGALYGLKGVDFDSLLVESHRIEAGTPYQLPSNTYWADAFAGDDGQAWPVLKVWQADGNPDTRTDPVTYNWATIQQGMRALQIARQAGHLTITVPKNQRDFSTGRDTIRSATLIVVTIKK